MVSDANKNNAIEPLWMTILILKDFLKKYILKDDTMKENFSIHNFSTRIVYNFSIYPRESKMTTDKGFVDNDIGKIVVFYLVVIVWKFSIHNILIVFGGPPDISLLYNFLKPMNFH